MKRLSIMITALLLLGGLLTSCGGGKGTGTGGDSLSLAKIKQAAKDAGYVVTDNFVDWGMDDVKGGFSVEIVADNQDVIYSVLECGSEEVAKKNAKTIDDAGYNIAITNGKFLTCYGVDKKNGTAKGILESILKGSPIAPQK